MSLILPLSFFSSINTNTLIENFIFDIITTGISTPYPDYNFIFGNMAKVFPNGNKAISPTLSGIGLMNTSYNLDPTFKPNLLNINSSVNTALLSSGNSGNFKFIIGGDFVNLGPSNTNYLCILNLSSVGGQFVESFTSSIPDGAVVDSVLTDRLYTIGVFNTVNPSTVRNGIAAYERNGTLSTFNWRTNITGYGYGMLICIKADNSGNIFIGGQFDTVTKVGTTTYTNRRAIVKIATAGTGTISTTFNPAAIFSASDIITDIEIMSDGRVIVALPFSLGDNLINYVIRLSAVINSGSTTYESFDEVIYNATGLSTETVTAIKIDNNGKLLINYGFPYLGFRLYRFNISGPTITLDTTFGVGGDGFISTSYVGAISIDSSNNIILGGDFVGTPIGVMADGRDTYYAVLNNSGALLNG
jgi:hypothetical protein